MLVELLQYIAEVMFCICGGECAYISHVQIVQFQVILNLGAMNKIISFDEVSEIDSRGLRIKITI